MEIYIAYGGVTAVMLGITFVFYSYKNWLALRKNGIYIRMLFLLLAVVLADVILGNAMLHFLQAEVILEVISRIIMSVGALFLFLNILLYDMAITQKMYLVKTISFRIFFGLITVISVISVAAPLLNHAWLYNQNQHGYGIFGKFLQVLVLLVCLCAGILLIICSKNVLNRREYIFLLATHCLLVFDVNMQIVLNARNLASYFTLAIVVILYYVLLHNSDQYVSFSSHCFDRDGFRKVVRERAQYKEDFTCLGICINNIESITNFCTEAEIAQLHCKMGEILRGYCGRHNVYHIHSFEYMIMIRSSENVEKKHQMLETGIPAYFRINNKNVSILCGFYTVKFSEAGYDMADFNRIITSMRKITMDQTDREVLLRYDAEKRENIQQDLEAMQIVNDCIANHSFDIEIALIQSLINTERMSCEFVLCKHMGGRDISQECIWEMAAESGYLKVTGYIMMEMLCKYITDRNWLEGPFYQFHVNLTSTQLASEVLAHKYIEILEKYHIPGDRICIEFTFDQNVDYEKLMESFLVFKEYGVSVLLDQFGVTVCNLKKVLNMPFDSVKVNHHMVRTFCAGNNHQLVYLVDMLNQKKWNIILDGIDDFTQIDMLREMKIAGVQGQAITKQSAARVVHAMELSDGRYVNS